MRMSSQVLQLDQSKITLRFLIEKSIFSFTFNFDQLSFDSNIWISVDSAAFLFVTCFIFLPFSPQLHPLAAAQEGWEHWFHLKKFKSMHNL